VLPVVAIHGGPLKHYVILALRRGYLADSINSVRVEHSEIAAPGSSNDGKRLFGFSRSMY
jgi:hypothetical protein